MRNLLAAILLVCALVVPFVASARVAPMPSAERVNLTVPAAKAGDLQLVRDAIVSAAGSLAWQLREESEGRIVLQRIVRSKHTVDVAVHYDASGITVEYLSSVNMNYREKNGKRYIHPNYGHWVSQLAHAVIVRSSQP